MALSNNFDQNADASVCKVRTLDVPNIFSYRNKNNKNNTFIVQTETILKMTDVLCTIVSN